MKPLFIHMMILSATLLSYPASAETGRALISASITSADTFTIIARGYPKDGVTDPASVRGTAHEAAILNAQLLAKEYFVDGYDIIVNGEAESFTDGDGYADVTYVITSHDISQYLKEVPQ